MKRRQFLKFLPVLPAAYIAQAELQAEYEDGLYNEPPVDIDMMTAHQVFHLLMERVAILEGRNVRKCKSVSGVRVSPIMAPRIE